MATITVTGVDRVAHKLKTIDDISKHLGSPMTKSLNHLHKKMSVYPRKSAGAFTRWATPAQRRAYWAKVRSGEAKHGPNGYIRSGQLRRGWTQNIKHHSNGMTGELSNKTEQYAQYVVGERQQPFHIASNWPQVDKVAAKESKAVQGYFNAAIRELLRR